MLYDFDDILIQPAEKTRINSRFEINHFTSDGKLPLFTAPMDTVVGEANAHIFVENGITTILPRVPVNVVVENNYSVDQNVWRSYGLDEFRKIFLDSTPRTYGSQKLYALIDIANGHMPSLSNVIQKAKTKYGETLVLMVGNVANPRTYGALSNLGADYVRIGIGNGCFIDGTIVKTTDGEKRIEEIKSGDFVLTHLGNYKEVVSTKRFEHQGDLIKINDEITCTPDHKFYVLNRKYIDAVNDENLHTLCEWVSAMELYNNPDYLLVELKDYESDDNSIPDGD